jgi:hypothetical protein
MNIAEKIRKFFDDNEQAKKLKKILEPLNKEIKDHLRNVETGIETVDDIQAVLSIQNRQSMNSDKLLAKLKKLKRKDLIRKIETPDMEKIEKLIYEQQLDASVLADCLETKQVEVLTIGKVKKKKEESEDAEN